MIRLYRARYSTNVERVALTLALKGLGAESVWITYDDRTQVEQVSGQPLVPVLDYDGEIVAGSMDIVRFIDERHPDPPLRAQDPDVLDFVDWFDTSWKGPPNRIEQELTNPHPDDALIEELAAQMRLALDRFDDMLAVTGHLVGETLTAADICAFPFLKYATLHDPQDGELFHLILRDRQRDGRERPRLAAWIDRLNALPRA